MKSLNRISFVFLFFVVSLIIHAQISIDGTITDADNKPIKQALVEIFDQNDSLNNYRTVTDASGYFILSNITDVGGLKSNVPNEYLIIRNYPNPFNPSTIIYFEIPKAQNIEIKIYDILGREIRTLYNNFHKAGVDQIYWDGRNNSGYGVSAGIYLCRLKTHDQFKVHKMVLLDGGSNISFSSNTKLSKSKIQNISKVNFSFNFSVKVSGDSIAETYFHNLVSKQDTTLNLKVPKLTTANTIGSGGGTLETDGFSLEVPGGAFASDITLKLFKDPNNSFGDNSCSPIFRIEGLPNEFTQPLQVSIKYNGTLSGENAILYGNITNNLDIESNIITYNLLDVIESNNKLISVLPVNSNNNSPANLKKNNDDDVFAIFMALTQGSHVTTDHFYYINFATNLSSDQRLTMELFLNQMYTKYQNLGFDYLMRDWPMTIKLFNKDYTYYLSNYKKNSSSIDLGISKDFSLQENKNLALIEIAFFETILKSFWRDLSGWWNKPPFYWLDIASLQWLRRNYISWLEISSHQNSFTEFVNETFKGLENFDINSAENIEDHGHGMGLLIEYLLNRYGESKISKIYNDIGNGKNHVQAIIDATDSPLNWLKDFYKYLIENSEFKELLGDYWSTNATKIVNVALLNEEKIVSDNFYDLSGKWYKVDLSENIAPRSKLKITSTTNGIAQISVFTIKGNNLSFISSAEEELEVLDVEKYSAEGKDLIVLITNPNGEGEYKDTREITTKFKLIGKFSYIKVKFGGIDGTWHYEDVRDSTNDYPGVVVSVFWPEYPANFSGNSFSVNYDVTDQSSRREEFYMTATLSENWDMIVNCSVSRVVTGLHADGSWGGIDSCEFAASNIPLVGTLNDRLTFQLKGANMSNMIFYNYIFLEYQGLNYDNSDKLIQWWPDDGSYLRIYLYTNL